MKYERDLKREREVALAERGKGLAKWHRRAERAPPPKVKGQGAAWLRQAEAEARELSGGVPSTESDAGDEFSIGETNEQ